MAYLIQQQFAAYFIHEPFINFLLPIFAFPEDCYFWPYTTSTSNDLSDFVELLIPAFRKDHDAITLEIVQLENELKGQGIGKWTDHCWI